MLKLMRDSFHQLKWILLAIVAAFIIGFVYVDMGLGGASRNPQQDVRAYAARVNGETISFREYERALYYTTQNYERMYGGRSLTPDMIEQMGLPKQVLDSLVDQHLLLQQAQRLHLTATPDEVRARILEIPVLNTGGKFVGEEMYTRYVTGSLGYTSPAEFEDELRREITLSKMESALSNSLIISPKAAEAEYRRISESAKIRYAVLPLDKVAQTVTVTPAEVDQYYQQNQSKYTHGEQREIKYLVADTNSIRARIFPTDAELKQRYESNKEDYKRPPSARILHILIKVDPKATPDVDAKAKAKADGIVKQLRAGGDFAALAKANSEDPSSSGNGGDMGFVDQGRTVQSFDTAAFSIPLNTISDPIRSAEYGYHIIKVLERREAGYRSLEEVKPQIAQILSDEQAKNRARDAITTIASRMRDKKPKNVDEFTGYANAAVTGVSSNDVQWFGKGDPLPGLGNNPAIAAWAFAANLGDVSDIIGTQRGPAIAYLYNVRKAGITAESENRPKVEADARAAKARDTAKAAMAGAFPAANVDELAKKLGVTASETSVNRQGFIGGFRGDTTPLVDAAMGANVGELKGPVVLNEGAVAFQVTEQKKVDAADLEKNKASYGEQLRQQEARSLRTVLLQRLRKTAKVDVNDSLLNQQRPQQQAGL